MPVVSDEELAGQIKSGQILILLVDTSIFVANHYSFHNEPLRSLTQFADSRYGLMIPSVIFREIEGHYIEKIDKTHRALTSTVKSALGPFGIVERRADEIVSGIIGHADVLGFAVQQVRLFFEECGADIISESDYVSVEDVLSRYFCLQPPFSEKKKEEFPDAIALLGLQGHLMKQGLKCIVVSEDGDWKEFCRVSDHVFYHSNLVLVLSWLARPDTGFNRFWEGVGINDDASEMYDELLEYAESVITEMDVDIDVTANYSGRVEVEHTGTAVSNLQFVPEETALIINQNEAENLFVASFRVSADVTFDISLSHLVWDSIDKEEIHLNSSWETVEDKVDFRMEATIRKEDGKFSIDKISVPNLWKHVYLDPVDVF